MILELFKRWSELEPDRCQPCGNFSFAIKCDFPGDFVLPGAIAAEDAQPCAKLLWALLLAIGNRRALYKLEDDEQGRHYAYVRRGNRLAVRDADNPAIALLMAYLAWLEAVLEVQAA